MHIRVSIINLYAQGLYTSIIVSGVQYESNHAEKFQESSLCT
jgi:hypothetical protein